MTKYRSSGTLVHSHKNKHLAAERDFSDVGDIAIAYRMIIESDDCTTSYVE